MFNLYNYFKPLFGREKESKPLLVVLYHNKIMILTFKKRHKFKTKSSKLSTLLKSFPKSDLSVIAFIPF